MYEICTVGDYTVPCVYNINFKMKKYYILVTDN